MARLKSIGTDQPTERQQQYIATQKACLIFFWPGNLCQCSVLSSLYHAECNCIDCWQRHVALKLDGLIKATVGFQLRIIEQPYSVNAPALVRQLYRELVCAITGQHGIVCMTAERVRF